LIMNSAKKSIINVKNSHVMRRPTIAGSEVQRC